jgi:hypothetical protein
MVERRLRRLALLPPLALRFDADLSSAGLPAATA